MSWLRTPDDGVAQAGGEEYEGVAETGSPRIDKGEQETLVKLAIVDDEVVQAEQIKQEVLRWNRNNHTLIDIHTFSSGEEILKYFVMEEDGIDIVLLDIQMNRMDGIQTGKKIRSLKSDCIIIYITNYLDPVCESFKVGAFRYILKNQMHEAIQEALDHAMENVKDEHRYFIYNSKKQEIRLLMKKIMFFESQKRIIQIKLSDGTQREYYGKMTDVEKQIVDRTFVRCHQSFVVNTSYIDRVEGTYIYLNNGFQIPISHKYMKDLEKAIMWSER
jgi:DNA-binding LytR/AlgR family response regulator